jgi:hypothetical protein
MMMMCEMADAVVRAFGLAGVPGAWRERVQVNLARSRRGNGARRRVGRPLKEAA